VFHNYDSVRMDCSRIEELRIEDFAQNCFDQHCVVSSTSVHANSRLKMEKAMEIGYLVNHGSFQACLSRIGCFYLRVY